MTTGRVTRAHRRLVELKTAGVQLSELLGGEAGQSSFATIAAVTPMLRTQPSPSCSPRQPINAGSARKGKAIGPRGLPFLSSPFRLLSFR